MMLERACLCGNVINHCVLRVNNLFLMRKVVFEMVFRESTFWSTILFASF